MRAPTLLTLAAGIIVLLLAACGGESEEASPQPSAAESASPTRTPGGMEARLKLDKGTYAPGEPVRISLTLTNRGDTSVKLFFRDGQRYEFEVFAANQDTPVWRWSAGRAFIQVLGEESLGPGQTLTYSETWDQRGSDGEPAPRGPYQARGTVVGCRDQSFRDCGFAASVPFEITP